MEALVIADPHCTPGHNNDRLEYAAKFALKRKPEYIICLGDFAEMGSLSRYDVGKLSGEGKRYADDLAAAHDGLERFNKPIEDYNRKAIADKKKQYKPRMIMCMGNHENRINLAVQDKPNLYGHMSTGDLKYEEYGWEVYGLTEPAIVEGIAFSHYFTSGVMGKPIGGLNHARSLVIKTLTSCVVGHSHLLDFHRLTSVVGEERLGLVAGCYFDYDMDWSTENNRYWRGLVYLHDMENGYAECEFLNLETYLRGKYGAK
jgi:predicted phosphodiesterase